MSLYILEVVSKIEFCRINNLKGKWLAVLSARLTDSRKGPHVISFQRNSTTKVTKLHLTTEQTESKHSRGW